MFLVTVYTLSAAPIAVFSTGVDANGQLLADGSVDPHYQLIESASPQYQGPDAFVVDTRIQDVGRWVPSGFTSGWISIRPDAGTHNPLGQYIYRTTFDLSGLDVTTAMLMGRMATDDPGTVLLNGAATGVQSCCYHRWTEFSLTSGFVAGLNTLDFVVANSGGGPTGLRVEVSGSADVSVVPELGSWMLLGSGVALTFLRKVSRHRRRV
jgi:hypothetical protein